MNTCLKKYSLKTDNYSFLINDYLAKYRRYNQLVFKKIQSFSTISDAVEYIALAIDLNGKRFGHQQRFKKETLILSKNILLKNTAKFNKAKDFHSLLEIITELILPIRGVGELYCYDTALKLGSFLRLFPEYIYLHSGTRTGAQKMNLDYKKKYLLMNEIPKELQKLSPYELEDFLCIYKDEFK